MTHAHYRECHAKSGKGKERTALLAELRLEELLLDHYIIRTVCLGDRKVDEALAAERKVCEAKIAQLCSQLEEITKPPKKQPEPCDHAAAAAEHAAEWGTFTNAKRNRLARDQMFHREFHGLADAIKGVR